MWKTIFPWLQNKMSEWLLQHVSRCYPGKCWTIYINADFINQVVYLLSPPQQYYHPPPPPPPHPAPLPSPVPRWRPSSSTLTHTHSYIVVTYIFLYQESWLLGICHVAYMCNTITNKKQHRLVKNSLWRHVATPGDFCHIDTTIKIYQYTPTTDKPK